MGESMGLWLVFFAVIAGLMILIWDFLNRKDTIIDSRTSLGYSAFYMVLAALFGIWLWNKTQKKNGMDYFTAYMIELSHLTTCLLCQSYYLISMSRENINTVFYSGELLEYYSCAGAMIAAGVVIVESFSWALYILLPSCCSQASKCCL